MTAIISEGAQHIVSNSIKKTSWVNITFFSITTLGFLAGAPFYIHAQGISFPEIALFLFYIAATALSITVGYHRLYAHSTFKTNPVIEFFLLFFGAAAFEQTAYKWASQHRDHHRYVDTDLDPYSIKKGFWYAHIGWLIFWDHKIHYFNAKDLARNPLVMNQHKYYLLWAAGAGIVLPVLIGALTGHALGALIFAVCGRITLVYHSTFFINSICHMFGKATYDIYATARDNALIALLTFGEGYHNFHHRFPADYRNGVRWYQWDPSKWLIALLSWVGWAQDLRRVSAFRILEARMAGENQRVFDALNNFRNLPGIQATIARFQEKYQGVKKQLAEWDVACRDYQEICRKQMTAHTAELKRGALKKMEIANDSFKQARHQWSTLIQMKPLKLHQMFQNSLC